LFILYAEAEPDFEIALLAGKLLLGFEVNYWIF
jgi:hypothetical protein